MMRPPRLKMSEINYQMMQCHIPEEQKPQLPRCKSLKYSDLKSKQKKGKTDV